MTTFRYKPDKIKYLTSINTLDTVHRKYVSDFEERRRRIIDLKNEISNIETQLSQLDNPELLTDSSYTLDDIKQRSELKTKLQKIHQELFDIENNISELEYYSQTNDILLDYYKEIVCDQLNECINNHSDKTNTNKENSKSKLEELNLLSQKRRKPKKVTRRRVRKTDIINTKSILDFFNDKPVVKNKSESRTDSRNNLRNDSRNDSYNDSCNNLRSDSHRNVPDLKPNLRPDLQSDLRSELQIEQIISNKATLFDDYMTLVDKTYTSKERRNVIRICTKCNVEKTLIQSEGFYVCQSCGEVEHAIIESEVPSHKDSITEKGRYPYKRLNHLTEYPWNCLEILNELVIIYNRSIYLIIKIYKNDKIRY